MLTRMLHTIACVTSFVTIFALAFALAIQVGTIPSEPREGSFATDPVFLRTLLWVGCVGGFLCATLVAVKTAWSIYSVKK